MDDNFPKGDSIDDMNDQSDQHDRTRAGYGNMSYLRATPYYQYLVKCNAQ